MHQQRFTFKSSKTLSLPISAQVALGETPVIKELFLLNPWVLWLEQRPLESGRTTLLIRPWARPDCTPQELTPAPINMRSRIHGYGGGVVAASINKNHLLITWVDALKGILFYQSFIKLNLNSEDQSSGNWFKPDQEPIPLSKPGKHCLADGSIDLIRERWIGVMENNDKDYLVSFSLKISHQNPQILYSPVDFLGYPTLNNKGDQLAWIEWKQPSMPWDSSQLWWGRVNELGEINEEKPVAGSNMNKKAEIAVFQPIWLRNDQLVVSEDSSGWSNLIIADFQKKSSSNSLPQWKRMWPMESESSMPQWVHGMSTTAAAEEILISANCQNGAWRLNLLGLDGSQEQYHQPFNDLSLIKADKSHVVALASNSHKAPGLLEIDLESGSWMYTPTGANQLDESLISKPESFWFEGFNGEKTHSWYYPPSLPRNDGIKPLLVKSHSGPTAMASPGLDLVIQFWTSRGWGVVDVNYAGSTGFGRTYRERLKGNWGVADSFDCIAVVKELIGSGYADKQYIAIEGGSAGGFTTLCCLFNTDIFSVASCKYGVSDLLDLAKDTHRFEKGYLNYLVSEIDNDISTYKIRSPINNIDKIKCPIILFQGLKDKVVPPEQTNKIFNLLRDKLNLVEFHSYPNESHGFRDPLVKIDVLEKMETFFNHHLRL